MVPSVRTASPTKRRGCFLHCRSPARPEQGAVTKKGVRNGSPKGDNHSLHVLDEPTIGLHMADVAKLIEVLHRLVDAGNTVVLIEHNPDIVAEADHVIDLGPEGGGGDGGGRIAASSSPAKAARSTRRSHTGRDLDEFPRERGVLG